MTKRDRLENELLDLIGKVEKNSYKEIDIVKFMNSVENYIRIQAFLNDLSQVLIKHNVALTGFSDGGVSFEFNEDTLYPVSGVELDNDQNIVTLYSKKD